MYCIDTKALVFMFNREAALTALLASKNNINNEKHMHFGFLALQVYLCSTSLK